MSFSFKLRNKEYYLTFPSNTVVTRHTSRNLLNNGGEKLKCVHCGNEQANAGYCWKCGTPLGRSSATTSTQLAVPYDERTGEVQISKVNATIQLEKFKDFTKQYKDYFLAHVKHPSISLSGHQPEFVNGILSLFLYAVLFGLLSFVAIKEALQQSYGNMEVLGMNAYGSPSSFSVFFTIFLFVVVCMAVVTLALFMTNKLLGPDYTGKKILIVYSAHVLPAVVISLVACGLLLVGSVYYGSLLLVVSLFYVVMLAPIYVVSILVSKRPKGIDPLYGFTVFALFLALAFGMLYRVLQDAAIQSYLSALVQQL